MADLRELCSIRDVRSAANGDALLLWAAGDLPHGTRAFALGEASAVVAPALSCRDRLVVTGPAADATDLIRAVLPQVGPAFRLIGDEELIRTLVTCVPELEIADAFGWMQTETSTNRHDGAAWLTASDRSDITALLDEAFPNSYARPERPGVRRWAGARDGSGTLLACAADAWSAPSVGFLAGVATAEQARGRGTGTAVCSLVLDSLVADHGVAALLVDSRNTAAVRLCRSLGLSWRPLAAARVADGRHHFRDGRVDRLHDGRTDRLRRSAWQYVAEVLPPEDLPMLAAHALVDGHDSPALRELAGLPRRGDVAEIRDVYVEALHELGIPLPDEETAGRRLLASLAFGLARGELSPEDVADRLPMTVAARTQEETRFLSVAADYSEWLGPDELPGWEHDLRTAAHALTTSTNLGSDLGVPSWRRD